MKGRQYIVNHFSKQRQFFREKAPILLSETAQEESKGAFTKKAWDGKPWPANSPKYKPKKGSQMVRSSNLVNSIQEGEISPHRVVITAGDSKTPYARIHNEGGVIQRAARSETFRRNRYKRGLKKGRFQRGNTAGQGFTFKAYSIRMPQRQFIGHTNGIYKRYLTRLKHEFKKQV